jgi:hypothetical protein
VCVCVCYWFIKHDIDPFKIKGDTWVYDLVMFSSRIICLYILLSVSFKGKFEHVNVVNVLNLHRIDLARKYFTFVERN